MRSPLLFSRPLAFAVALCATAACKPAANSGTLLRVNAPQDDRDADVFIDGHYVGQVGTLAAAGTGGFKLAPGTHRLEVRKPGRFPVQRTVVVDKKTPATLVIRAELLEDPQ